MAWNGTCTFAVWISRAQNSVTEQQSRSFFTQGHWNDVEDLTLKYVYNIQNAWYEFIARFLYVWGI